MSLPPCGNLSRKSGARCVRPNGHSGHCCAEWLQTVPAPGAPAVYRRERFARPQSNNSGADMGDEEWRPMHEGNG